jgi:hypothetical protein
MIFLFCVFVIVLGLRNVGLVDRITELYSSAISPAAKVAVIGISSAIGSAVMNNHPMAILNALAINGLPEGKHRSYWRRSLAATWAPACCQWDPWQACYGWTPSEGREFTSVLPVSSLLASPLRYLRLDCRC